MPIVYYYIYGTISKNIITQLCDTLFSIRHMQPYFACSYTIMTESGKVWSYLKISMWNIHILEFLHSILCLTPNFIKKSTESRSKQTFHTSIKWIIPVNKMTKTKHERRLGSRYNYLYLSVSNKLTQLCVEQERKLSQILGINIMSTD